MGLKQNLLIITVVAAAALPVLTYLALEAGNRYRELQLDLAGLQRQEARLDEHARHVDRYMSHMKVMEQFVIAAERAGVSPAHWNTHRVEIDDIHIAYGDLDEFIGGMSTGPGSYFVPERLVMETRPTVTRVDIAAAGGRGEVFEGGVTLSLAGEFMVER